MRTKQQAMKRRRTKGLAYAALLAGLGLAALLALALAPGAGGGSAAAAFTASPRRPSVRGVRAEWAAGSPGSVSVRPSEATSAGPQTPRTGARGSARTIRRKLSGRERRRRP